MNQANNTRTMKLEIHLKADNHLKPNLLAGLADLVSYHDINETTAGLDRQRFELTLCHETKSPDTFLDNLATLIAEIENSLPENSAIEVLIKNSECSEPTLRTSTNYRPFSPVSGIRVVPWPDLNGIESEPQDIILDSSSDAFGNGLHPSTQLCLQLLLQAAEQATEIQSSLYSVLDVGCGSGILALAAIRLGAESAVGIEIDQQAVQTACRNVELNNLDTSVKILQTSWQAVNGHYDIVLANLVPSVLGKAAPYLAELLNPQGMLITAGFPAAQNKYYQRLLEDNGLRFVTESSLAGWGALLLSH
jgi:ribosomal protein L11 methyltransferase